MDPVPGVSRVGTLGTREAEEDEAVVGSTDETENDVLVQVTTKTDLDTGSTWACEADGIGQGGAHGAGTGGDADTGTLTWKMADSPSRRTPCGFMLLHAAAGSDTIAQEQPREVGGLGRADQGRWYRLATSET